MDEQPEEEVLRLSDAFMSEKKIEGYEWSVRILNVNYGKNKELMKKCKPLQDYAILVEKIRENMARGFSTHESIDKAVVECIQEDILTEFLRKHRAEVLDVCLTEYDEERVIKSIREEEFEFGLERGREEGREEGREQERERLIMSSYRKGKTAEAIAEFMDVPLEKVKEILWKKFGEM